MSDPHIKAAFYLSPTLDEWWRWNDDAQVLTWWDGATIAFAPEVETVLIRLEPGGLPPFGALALLLAACRDGWTESAGRAMIAGYVKSFGQMGIDAGGNVPGESLQFVFGRMVQESERILA